MMKGDKILKLDNGGYLFIGKNIFSIYKLERKKAGLECSAGNEYLKMEVVYNGINKECWGGNFDGGVPFNYICNVTQRIELELYPVEPGNGWQIAGGILFLVGLFVCVLYKLIVRQKEIRALSSQIC